MIHWKLCLDAAHWVVKAGGPHHTHTARYWVMYVLLRHRMRYLIYVILSRVLVTETGFQIGNWIY
jgi:hypothetical protein